MTSAKSNKYIHIGIHKAGSTFIQAELLPKLKKITPITFYDSSFLSDEIIYISQCANLYYDKDCEKRIKDALKEKTNIFISSEALSGTGHNIYTAGYMIESIAQRLKKILDNPKILICIRKQKAVIESLYKDDVKYGFLGDFKNWFKNRAANCQFDYFKYHALVKLYIDIFGKDNVHAYLFEDLFDPDKTRNLLVDMGIDPLGIEDVDFSRRFNESYSPLSLKLTFLINRFFGSKLTHGVTFGKDPRLRVYNYWRYQLSKKVDNISYALGIKNAHLGFSGYQEELYKMFHENNLKVSKLIGINLQEYGYI